MPIYEYKCGSCQNQFETIVFRSNEVVCCPNCNSAEVTKLMSACSFKSEGNDGSVKKSAGTSGCSGCSATSCATCH